LRRPSVGRNDGRSALDVPNASSGALMTIKLTLNAQTVTEGQTIFASTFVSSVTDSTHRAITKYSVYDSGKDGGYFVLNGVKLTDGAWHILTAAQFAQLQYVAGSGVGSETISIKAYDGATWSSAYSTTETTAAPSGSSSIVTLLGQLGVSATVAQQLTANNSLSYNGMLTILQDAAVGGMTTTKFSALKTLASMLNQTGGLTTSAYVQQIADDVILGNSANAKWNGGSSTATTLGNLTATSTQAQVTELIGKWFLGTDLPSLDVSGIGESNLNPTYQTSTLPLFASGGPNYLDVNQGYLGDCYFVAALGETALQDPNLIKNMITDNGNGTYSVLFYVNGQPDYVTVNGQLPVMSGGYAWANGSTTEFANGTVDDWVALVEKAFVQLNEQTAAAGYGGHPTGNAYEDVNGGTAITLSEITDETFNTYNLYSGESSSSLSALMSTLAADWAAGDEIILSTPTADNGNLVGDHMYIITGINAAAGTISIQNPWNSAYSGSLQMSFTDTIALLAADNVSIYATTGTKVA
jgi:hypothetical protein